MIKVTETFLPPQSEFNEILKQSWELKWITNNGDLYKLLQKKLAAYLNVKYILPMTNGTLPIQIALKEFGKQGEIITTPFSYVATTSSIIWEGCKPIYVDIDPQYFTIDSSLIEASITPKTTCILATHVYGNPCDIDKIEEIGLKYNLRVIYDGAHCFGVNYKDKSIFTYGDISTCSFHATKIFHTAEGGALFCNTNELYDQMWYLHNFGHKNQSTFEGIGINAKMSEIQAAMGLSVLPYMDYIINSRKSICYNYDSLLDLSKVQKLKIRKDTEWNYSYYPIVFNDEKKLMSVMNELNNEMIFPRRYFYPSLNNLSYTKGFKCNVPVSESIATRILCLPLYVGLKSQDVKRIAETVNKYS